VVAYNGDVNQAFPNETEFKDITMIYPSEGTNI
jgi:hypothetical protein